MRVRSFIRYSGDSSDSFNDSSQFSSLSCGRSLIPIDVELSLSPGLPQIQFLGLPDAALRESVLRIRSALREQGFRLPQAQQVLVHLKPTHLRKSSRGLDLAVAAALLWETDQLPRPAEGIDPILYGELTLKGEVVRPDDLQDLELDSLSAVGMTDAIYTGTGNCQLPFAIREVSDLQSLAEPIYRAPVVEELFAARPLTSIRTLSRSAAEIGMVVAAGEHSALLAGPPGSGKSTLAEAIPCWIEEPNHDCLRRQRKLLRSNVLGRQSFGETHANLRGESANMALWRPIMRPHHSITPLAMIGGGVPPYPGEISRAHEGVLIMDELLEFAPEIQEALREPIESGEIRISRGRSSRVFPASVLLVATTNLCPCGKFVPGESNSRCRCTKAMLRRMLGRLAGPFVDRFAIVALSDRWSKLAGEQGISVDEIKERVAGAIRFRREERKQTHPNSKCDFHLLEASLTKFQRENLLADSQGLSRRRMQAVHRVARTFADLELSHEIRNTDLESALRLSLRGHQRLEESLD